MLRKIIHILITLLLIVTTTGVTFSMHYCGGELISTSVNTDTEKCCDGAGGCCEDINLRINIDDDYLTTTTTDIMKVTDTQAIVLLSQIIDNQLTPVKESYSDLRYRHLTIGSVIQVRLALLQVYLC
jgi:hypothetical protein